MLVTGPPATDANFSGAPPKIYLPGPYTARYYGGLKLSYHR